MGDYRFWEKVDTSAGPDGCWYWEGYCNDSGYGIVTREGKRIRAHRLAYADVYGEIPAGMELDHTCHNGSGCNANNSCTHRRCVNPNHLEPVTHKENVRRGESPSGYRSRATRCVHGHEFTQDNTRFRGDHRQCRECHRIAQLLLSRIEQGREGVPLDTRVRKTHCSAGHEFSTENTIHYTNPNTGVRQRHCRQCRVDRAKAACAQEGRDYRPSGEAKPFCKNGHAMTPENTFTQKRAKGVSKSCRECRRAASRRAYTKSKESN